MDSSMTDDEVAAPPWEEGAPIKMPPPSKSSTRGGATNWRSSPEREFLRCLTAALYRERRLRRKSLARAFKDLVPDYDDLLGELKDDTISAKGYNSWFYKSEHPDKNPKTAPIYELAVKVVRRGRRVNVAKVLAHVGKELPAEVEETVTTLAEAKLAETVITETVDETHAAETEATETDAETVTAETDAEMAAAENERKVNLPPRAESAQMRIRKTRPDYP